MGSVRLEGLNHVGVRVRDLRRSAEWYANFGFRLIWQSELRMSTRRLIAGALAAVPSVLLLGHGSVSASRVRFRGIDEVAKSIDTVVLGTVLTKRSSTMKMKLPDGADGPTTHYQTDYEVRVQKVLFGGCLRPDKTIRVSSMIAVPVQRDEWGQEVLHWSPTVDRGENDHDLSEGSSYLFSFGYCDAHDAVHPLLRSDPPSSRTELLDAIKRSRAASSPTQPAPASQHQRVAPQ